MRYLYSCRALFVLHEAELCNKGSRSGRERGVGGGGGGGFSRSPLN